MDTRASVNPTDERLLYPPKETEVRDVLEIAEAKYKKASAIFCSQFGIPGWRDKLGVNAPSAEYTSTV